MRRSLLLLVCGLRCFAALPSTTTWEVRPTVGSDTTAGGCFVTGSSGTDYSQQNAAQYTGTDLAASGATNIIVAVSHSFVAADVGNCIHITTTGTGALFIIGYYQIVSVSLGTATLDRAAASSAAAAGGTYYVGGALATVAQANSNATASNQIWVKATGTYTVTSALALTMNSSGGTSVPYAITGYTSARGDGGQFTWTTATNSTNLITAVGAQNVILRNINFTTSAGTVAYGLAGGVGADNVSFYVINCKFTGFLIGIYGNYSVDSAFQGLFIINSRVTTSTSHGVQNWSTTHFLGSLIDNNATDGGNWQGSAIGDSSSWIVENSIFYKNGGHGLDIAGQGGGSPVLIVTNSIFSTNTLNGILTQNTLVPQTFINNSIFDANGAYGVSSGSGGWTMPWLGFKNAFYNNGLAPTLNINAGTGTITLSASPYVSVGTNFALNTTVGGGASLFNAGFPGALSNGGGTGSLSVGALQPAASLSGGQHGFPIVQ